MKHGLNKYWIFIAAMIVINIFIFINLSRSLETYVINHILDTQVIDNI